MPKTELKPCPFCGGKATVKKFQYSEFYPETLFVYFIAHCQKCEASMMGDDKEKVIRQWNRRVKDNEAN